MFCRNCRSLSPLESRCTVASSRVSLSEHATTTSKPNFSLAPQLSVSLHNHNHSPRSAFHSTHTCSSSHNNKMASSQTPKPPLASNPSQPQQRSQPGLKYPSSGKTIYHRPLARSRTSELSQASFAYLFGEMVSYAQRRVTGIQDLEKR